MRQEIEVYQNPAYPYIFRKSVAPGEQGVMDFDLTGHGYITQVNVIFAAGENGTLKLRPYVEHPGELISELLKYAGDQFITGDDCNYKLPCYQEVENHSRLKVWYQNTGLEGSDNSQIMVDIIVQYDTYIEPKNVIG